MEKTKKSSWFTFYAILLLVLSFPENDWSFSFGIDQPLLWVFNHLFAYNIQEGKNIIFPHGPLAFLIYPTDPNIEKAAICSTFLKIIHFYCISKLLKLNSYHLSFFISLFIFTFSDFNQLFYFTLFVLIVHNHKYENFIGRYISIFITSLSFFIKADIAMVSLALFFSGQFYYVLVKKKFIKPLHDVLSLVGFTLIIWVLIYKNVSGYISYFIGFINLVGDNSSAVGLYPRNNWILLPIGFIFLILFFIKNRKEKDFLIVSFMILISGFVMWKYGMAREDTKHYSALLKYIFFSLLIACILFKKSKIINPIIGVMVFIPFFLNAKNISNSNFLKPNLHGLQNFWNYAMNNVELHEKSDQKTLFQIKRNLLSKNIIDSINNSSIDIYPWDYSYIAINNLNWHPRPVIHSYAAYTPWLDNKNKNHFESHSAPKYLLIHKHIGDVFCYGDYYSIDNRYLFNDEPLTFKSTTSNYKFWKSFEEGIILKKRNRKLIFEERKLLFKSVEFGEWIDVPKIKSGFLTVAFEITPTFSNKIISLLYKGNPYWIAIKNKSGLIKKYRIIPENGKNGILLNPIFISNNYFFEAEEIMFLTSDNKYQNNIDIQFVANSSRNEPNPIQSLFNPHSDKIVLDRKVISPPQIIPPNSFSNVLTLNIDSNNFQFLEEISVTYELQTNFQDAINSSQIVIAIEKNQKQVFWKGKNTSEQLLDKNSFNIISSFLTKEEIVIKPPFSISTYIWNTTNEEIKIKNGQITQVNLVPSKFNHSNAAPESKSSFLSSVQFME